MDEITKKVAIGSKNKEFDKYVDIEELHFIKKEKHNNDQTTEKWGICHGININDPYKN